MPNMTNIRNHRPISLINTNANVLNKMLTIKSNKNGFSVGKRGGLPLEKQSLYNSTH